MARKPPPIPRQREPLLDLAEVDRFKRNFLLFAEAVVEGFFSGKHRSPYFGSNVEFADYKEYVNGDDVSNVDWRVYARTHRLFVRKYHEETDMVIYLMVDTSGSMRYSGVGGPHLVAALDQMKPFGRIVLCGMISQYNVTRPPRGPGNLILAIIKRLTLKGFIVTDHLHRQQAFLSDMSRWMAEGRIAWKETIVEGIESAPRAFLGLFSGDNLGKMLVRLGPGPGE